MTTTTISVAFPEELLEEIDRVAGEEQRSREEVIIESARRYVGERRWRRAQAVIAQRAREMGIRTEDDVEDLVDSVRD